jgi:hypothetical protein
MSGMHSDTPGQLIASKSWKLSVKQHSWTHLAVGQQDTSRVSRVEKVNLSTFGPYSPQ